MLYYKDKNDNIIIPTAIDVMDGSNRDACVYEHKINTYYLRLLLEILTKTEFNIFLASLSLVIDDASGFPLYYGYQNYYDTNEDSSPFYNSDELCNMLCERYDFNEKDVVKTITKLVKAQVIVPKKSYITINNEIGYVLFLNESVISYENTGMGVGYLSDLKRDENGIVTLESYCELPYSYYHPKLKRKVCESQIDRTSKEAKDWTNAIKERDKYVCQCCGSTERKGMASHHIKNWALYKELRYELSNGMCLCENCHNPYLEGSFHNVYGTRRNTPEQLLEYIKTKRNELGITDTSFIKSPFLLEHIEEI